MLFSKPEISKFVRENFVAAWENVRTVPIVEIDFGGGRKLTRTAQGNIATYVCRPDGTVVDVIPGLNTPESYLADLRAAVALAKMEPEELRSWHLAVRELRMDAADMPVLRLDMRKKIIEGPVKEIAVEDALLAADTKRNSRERKPIVHAILAEKTAKPAELTRRIYKEVLHCDLDDPYLGLAVAGGGYEIR